MKGHSHSDPLVLLLLCIYCPPTPTVVSNASAADCRLPIASIAPHAVRSCGVPSSPRIRQLCAIIHDLARGSTPLEDGHRHRRI
eukprot:4691391-Pleurochrysis_carterae.AAC.1